MTDRPEPDSTDDVDDTPTLDEVVDQWYDHIQIRVDLAPSTIQTYGRVSDHLVCWGKGRPLGTVDLSEYVLWRRRAEMAPRTIALELRIASAMFSWATKERVVGSDADLRIPRLKIDRRRFVLNHRTPTPSEAAKAIRAMPKDDWRLAVLLLGRTGARVGEVVALRGRDLDEAGGRIAFGASDASCKTGLRWFPLDSQSLTALTGRSDLGTDPLFDFEGVTAPIQALERRLFHACKAGNVSRFSPQGLRRMVVNRLMRAKVDPGTAAALTGHSVQVMLRFYQTVTEEDRRAAVEEANLGVLEDDLPPER